MNYKRTSQQRPSQTAHSLRAFPIMKTIALSILLALALVGSAMFTASAIAQALVQPPTNFSISWKYAQNWLKVERVNHKTDVDGFSPSFTHILIDKAYHPIVLQGEDGVYEIVFESSVQQPPR